VGVTSYKLQKFRPQFSVINSQWGSGVGAMAKYEVAKLWDLIEKDRKAFAKSCGYDPDKMRQWWDKQNGRVFDGSYMYVWTDKSGHMYRIDDYGNKFMVDAGKNTKDWCLIEDGSFMPAHLKIGTRNKKVLAMGYVGEPIQTNLGEGWMRWRPAE
jgi:hypothetical protein